MTTPQMLAFVPTGAVGALPDDGAIPDWIHNQIYFITSGTTGNTDGLHQFNGYPGGDESYAKTLDQLGLAEIEVTSAALAPSGYLAGNEVITNSTTICEILAQTAKLVGEFGIASSSLCPSGTNPDTCAGSGVDRILLPGSMTTLKYGNTEFFASTPQVSGFGEVALLAIPNLGITNLGPLDEHLGYIGPGAVGGGATSATAFVIAIGGATNLGFYRVAINSSGPTLTKVGTIAPTAVDATWTVFGAAAGCAYDQTDGNVIIFVGTTGKTNNNYFVKVNASSGAVIWALPVNSPTPTPIDLANCVIAHQTLYFLGGSSLLYTINTATGTATTQTLDSMTIEGGQVSEDLYGSFIARVSWTEGSTHPEYIGTYMGTEGNHTLTTTWMRYMPNGPISPPTPPPPPTPGVISINKAWTFVQDGHTFYVLDIGSQGTFAFDTVTQQWSKFETNGSNFAVVNGLMWAQRVVGGDPISGDLWELDPGATKDSGGLYEISHVVTGGISTRSRTYLSVSAFRVSASFGKIDDTAGVVFNLRFSDDQAQTWSPYFPIALVEGAYDTELAWNSLGSFAAPGRIFELSDSGGLIRIDGCDAFLDGFDNDRQSQDAQDPNQ